MNLVIGNCDIMTDTELTKKVNSKGILFFAFISALIVWVIYSLFFVQPVKAVDYYLNCSNSEQYNDTCSNIVYHANSETCPKNVSVNYTTNITYIQNTTNITVWNCSNTDLIGFFRLEVENLKNNVTGQLNYSGKYEDCNEARQSCIGTLTVCASKLNTIDTDYVNKTVYNQALKDLKSTDEMGWTRTLVACIGLFGVVWFFKLRKTSPQKTSRSPQSTQDSLHDSRTIDQEAKIHQLEIEKRELEEKLKKVV